MSEDNKELKINKKESIDTDSGGFKVINSEYSKLLRLITNNMNKRCSWYGHNVFHHHHVFPKEKVKKWLANPQYFQCELRNMSRHLYLTDPHYRRLINYFSEMHTWSYIISPYHYGLEYSQIDIEKYRDAYYKTANYLEKANIRHEMSKIAKICFKEDVFYGYKYETKDSFFIRQLPSKYCAITGIVDGCFVYDFDFSYFDTRFGELEEFGEEFVDKYNNIYKVEHRQWITLDIKNEFCIKLLEDVPFPAIPFMGVFEGIYDIDDYKSLKKAKAETDNYKVLALKAPVNEEGQFLIDRDIILEYYTALLNVLPENIGAFITPTEVKDFDFENAGVADNNNVNNAIKTFWNDAGVSSLIFGDENKTSGSLNISIKADEQMVFTFARQIERNINRLLKGMNFKYKFKIQFLDITIFNKDEAINAYLKGSQSSLPTKTMVCAAMGLEPIDMMGVNFIEDSVLNIPNTFKPLAVSYTQSGEAGSPTAEERGVTLSDSGEIARDAETSTEY